MGKVHAGYPELYRLHAKRYDCTIEQSEEIVKSVLDSISEMLKQHNVLSLQNFGKFETKYRAPYSMRSNLPDKTGEIKQIPAAYKLKFVASDKLNRAAQEYYQNKSEAEERSE